MFLQVSVILFTGEGVPCPEGSGPGGCLVETPRTATAAGGTHPTGMHSCFIYFQSIVYLCIVLCI